MSLLIKYGGSVAAGEGGDPVLRDLVRLQQDQTMIALVHGGGPAVDAELRRQGIPTQRIAGLRVTDAPILAIVEDVLGRQVNTAIVDALTAAGGRAQRVGGDDGVFIARRAHHPAGDLGFVGEVVRVDPVPVQRVIEQGGIPVVSPIGVDAGGQRYNINADTAAGALAAALSVDAYIVVTDVERVRFNRHDPASGIARMTLAQAAAYRDEGIFVDGMIPKIEAAVVAVRGGVRRAIISGAGPGAVSAALLGSGTEIVA